MAVAWSSEDEQHRQGCLRAGVTPRLHRFWASIPTGQLAVDLAEYRAKAPDLLADVISKMEDEIAYRTGGQN